MGLDIGCKCGRTGFRAGSYSGYNWWREILAKIAGIKNIWDFWVKAGNSRDGEEPFFELINFSDCEGTLPYKECKRLLKDFEKLAPILHGDGTELFWMKLFKLDIQKEEWDYWVEKFDKWHEAICHAVKDKCNIVFR